MAVSLHSDMLSVQAQLEALLFVAPGPVQPSQLAEALQLPIEQVELELTALSDSYSAERGISLQRHNGRVQLTSAPQASALVERFLGLEATARLSRAALEALAIIAYRQPVTRPAVDAIRGVNSDGVMRSLLMKGMIQETGRAETPGRPILYGVTSEFLQHFGLTSLADLPPYDVPDEADTLEASEELLKD